MDFESSFLKFLFDRALEPTETDEMAAPMSESNGNGINSNSNSTSTSSNLSVTSSKSGTVNIGIASQLNTALFNDNDDARTRLSIYLHQLAGHTDDCLSVVDMEHSYSRPWNWRPENTYAKPLKTLFMNKCQADRIPVDYVDVESLYTNPVPPYDCSKARLLMDECERQVSYVRPDDANDVDWEERIDKTLWTPGELRLFNKVVRILNSDKLARLTYKGHWNEPVMRRITVDKSARRFRQAMSLVDWDIETIQWLHCLLMEHLSSSYLASYFDILQTLKSKIPQLVDRMISVPPSALGRSGQAVNETLSILVKRPWDPANLSSSQQRSRKLPGGPLVVMVPWGPGPHLPSNCRPHHWLNHLSTIGTLISVNAPPGTINAKTNISSCLDQLVASTRSKITELRADYPGRAIILVGMYSGAVLACQVALVENVTAVVCLGFPLYSVDDKRGLPDDSILDLQVPVIFVIGQNSSLSSVEEMEDMREQMHAETGLIVVGGADDHLRISKSKKLKEGVTQSMVDRCILDEVCDFLGSILMTPYMPSRPPPPQHSSYSEPRRVPIKLFERKRKISDSKADSDASHRPAKRGRKPKTLSIQQKVGGNSDTGITGRWTTTGAIGTTSISSRPVVTQVTAVSTSGAGSVSGGLICKTVATPLTGLRLAPSNSMDNKSSSEMKTVQLSIQGSMVRQTSPVMPSEGGITVVASAPAAQPITTSSKDIVIQVANSSKSRSLSSSGSHLTSLSSLLQPAPTIVLSPSKSLRDDGLQSQQQQHHIIPTSIATSIGEGIDQSSLVEELTPDRILELPVIFEDQQPEEPQSDLSTVKLILGNNSGVTKKQPFKPTIPAIKYIKKSQPQSVKYTKIFLRKKDESRESAPTSVFVEEVDESELNATRGSRLRHIPATEHSQFC